MFSRQEVHPVDGPLAPDATGNGNRSPLLSWHSCRRCLNINGASGADAVMHVNHFNGKLAGKSHAGVFFVDNSGGYTVSKELMSSFTLTSVFLQLKRKQSNQTFLLIKWSSKWLMIKIITHSARKNERMGLWSPWHFRGTSKRSKTEVQLSF